MWNAIKEFFRKKDRVVVAIYVSGNWSIIKDGVPHVRLYTCWEDDNLRRTVKVTGRGPKDWRIEAIIEKWMNYGLLYDHIPSYFDVRYEAALPYGHDLLDGYRTHALGLNYD